MLGRIARLLAAALGCCCCWLLLKLLLLTCMTTRVSSVCIRRGRWPGTGPMARRGGTRPSRTPTPTPPGASRGSTATLPTTPPPMRRCPRSTGRGELSSAGRNFLSSASRLDWRHLSLQAVDFFVNSRSTLRSLPLSGTSTRRASPRHLPSESSRPKARPGPGSATRRPTPPRMSSSCWADPGLGRARCASWRSSSSGGST